MCLRSHRPFLHSSSTHSPSSVLAESRAPKRKKTQKYPVENKFPTLSPSHQNGSTGTHCPLVAGAHIRTPLDHSRTFLLLLLLLQGPVPQNRRLEWKQPAEQQRGGKAQKKVFEVETLAVALRMIRWEGGSLFIIFRLQNNNTMYTHCFSPPILPKGTVVMQLLLAIHKSTSVITSSHPPKRAQPQNNDFPSRGNDPLRS